MAGLEKNWSRGSGLEYLLSSLGRILHSHQKVNFPDLTPILTPVSNMAVAMPIFDSLII
jgi:hypothetical protein